mgnify:CR=1 FL=1
MFDIGFSELLFVALIALLVLGPERLPGALRTLGLWIGRIRRSVDDIRINIEQEIGADEIKRQLHNEDIMKKLNQVENQINTPAFDSELNANTDSQMEQDTHKNGATNNGSKSTHE